MKTGNRSSSCRADDSVAKTPPPAAEFNRKTNCSYQESLISIFGISNLESFTNSSTARPAPSFAMAGSGCSSPPVALLCLGALLLCALSTEGCILCQAGKECCTANNCQKLEGTFALGILRCITNTTLCRVCEVRLMCRGYFKRTSSLWYYCPLFACRRFQASRLIAIQARRF